MHDTTGETAYMTPQQRHRDMFGSRVLPCIVSTEHVASGLRLGLPCGQDY